MGASVGCEVGVEGVGPAFFAVCSPEGFEGVAGSSRSLSGAIRKVRCGIE